MTLLSCPFMSHTTLRTARTDRGCARFLSTESKRIKQTLRLALFAVLVIIMLNLYHRKEKQGALLSLKTQSRRPYNTRGMSRRVNDGTCVLQERKKKDFPRRNDMLQRRRRSHYNNRRRGRFLSGMFEKNLYFSSLSCCASI